MYICQQPTWQPPAQEAQLSAVRHRQGRVLGHMQGLGARASVTLDTLTFDVLKSS